MRQDVTSTLLLYGHFKNSPSVAKETRDRREEEKELLSWVSLMTEGLEVRGSDG